MLPCQEDDRGTVEVRESGNWEVAVRAMNVDHDITRSFKLETKPRRLLRVTVCAIR